MLLVPMASLNYHVLISYYDNQSITYIPFSFEYIHNKCLSQYCNQGLISATLPLPSLGKDHGTSWERITVKVLAKWVWTKIITVFQWYNEHVLNESKC